MYEDAFYHEGIREICLMLILKGPSLGSLVVISVNPCTVAMAFAAGENVYNLVGSWYEACSV
jgi:hypothetical protein